MVYLRIFIIPNSPIIGSDAFTFEIPRVAMHGVLTTAVVSENNCHFESQLSDFYSRFE